MNVKSFIKVFTEGDYKDKAKALENVVNVMSFKPSEFVNEINSEAPTLLPKLKEIARLWIKNAGTNSNISVDGRNEWAVKVCQRVVSTDAFLEDVIPDISDKDCDIAIVNEGEHFHRTLWQSVTGLMAYLIYLDYPNVNKAVYDEFGDWYIMPCI